MAVLAKDSAPALKETAQTAPSELNAERITGSATSDLASRFRRSIRTIEPAGVEPSSREVALATSVSIAGADPFAAPQDKTAGLSTSAAAPEEKSESTGVPGTERAQDRPARVERGGNPSEKTAGTRSESGNQPGGSAPEVRRRQSKLFDGVGIPIPEELNSDASKLGEQFEYETRQLGRPCPPSVRQYLDTHPDRAKFFVTSGGGSEGLAIAGEREQRAAREQFEKMKNSYETMIELHRSGVDFQDKDYQKAFREFGYARNRFQGLTGHRVPDRANTRYSTEKNQEIMESDLAAAEKFIPDVGNARLEERLAQLQKAEREGLLKNTRTWGDGAQFLEDRTKLLNTVGGYDSESRLAGIENQRIFNERLLEEIKSEAEAREPKAAQLAWDTPREANVPGTNIPRESASRRRERFRNHLLDELAQQEQAGASAERPGLAAAAAPKPRAVVQLPRDLTVALGDFREEMERGGLTDTLVKKYEAARDLVWSSRTRHGGELGSAIQLEGVKQLNEIFDINPELVRGLYNAIRAPRVPPGGLSANRVKEPTILGRRPGQLDEDLV